MLTPRPGVNQDVINIVDAFQNLPLGGGEQPQISKSVVLHIKDYGISMGVLSSFFHSPPTSSTRLFFFGSRLLRPRGRSELGAGGATSSSSSLEPAAYSCFIIGRLRSRYPLLHHWKTQATFKSQNSIKYIYIIAKQLTLSQYSYK